MVEKSARGQRPRDELTLDGRREGATISGRMWPTLPDGVSTCSSAASVGATAVDVGWYPNGRKPFYIKIED